MKLYTVGKKQRMSNHGKIEQVTIYPFGLKKLGFVIENNPINPEPEPEAEQQYNWSVNYSEMPALSNKEFDRFQNTMRLAQ